MIFNKHDLTLYLVTDQRWLKDESLASVVEKAIRGGVTMVQLREKTLTEKEFIEAAKEVKEICSRYQVPFIINDNIKVALAVDADGVHVGQEDMDANQVRQMIGDHKILGVSAHSVEEALKAKANGADYLGVGAMFETGSKTDASAVSMGTLNEIIDKVQLPVVAIGGINETNVNQLKDCPIEGIAVISAILAKADVYQAALHLRKLVNKEIKSQIKKVLTIAGSDSSGGAGIQADLKTMTALNMYGMSAITALTAQNTTGVYGIYDVPADFVQSQLDSVFKDIVPDAIKIGMVSQPEIIETIVNGLTYYNAKNIVVDPVMVATSGSKLMQDTSVQYLLEKLIPIATVITPNLSEAQIIADMPIHTKEEMIQAAKKIAEFYSGYILIKGGHSDNDANDLVYYQGQITWLEAIKLNNPNTHGTGCTLSSAIACFLAKGYEPLTAIQLAKDYVYQAIRYGLDIGEGRGPLYHMWNQ